MAKGKVYTIQITGLAADDYWFGEQRQSDANTEWRDTWGQFGYRKLLYVKAKF
ncbi:hypothetical protein [Winslowiella toletana]|uniref:hypothetical protein n=1 Tax=Winslowiella toletana TaxID=92490 RepID=UPI0028BDFBE9|nr:hypothetical protein [Winslowiella toletana]WNN46681.1 hypothetical protein RIN69_22380 [Winslowiella toletana]